MPLEDTVFHACKSENKWMEAALVHVPTVASWNQELQRVIENGVDGYLCKSEWQSGKKLWNSLLNPRCSGSRSPGCGIPVKLWINIQHSRLKRMLLICLQSKMLVL